MPLFGLDTLIETYVVCKILFIIRSTTYVIRRTNLKCNGWTNVMLILQIIAIKTLYTELLPGDGVSLFTRLKYQPTLSTKSSVDKLLMITSSNLSWNRLRSPDFIWRTLLCCKTND